MHRPSLTAAIASRPFLAALVPSGVIQARSVARLAIDRLPRDASSVGTFA